jgi:3'-phosphoadenosine 5'-phosphosulfate sulfotransferase
MDSTVIVAIVAGFGTAIGSIGGIITAARLTNYRLQQLEKKVEAHNNLVARTYELEGWREVCEEKLKVSNHRIDDLEKAI